MQHTRQNANTNNDTPNAIIIQLRNCSTVNTVSSENFNFNSTFQFQLLSQENDRR